MLVIICSTLVYFCLGESNVLILVAILLFLISIYIFQMSFLAEHDTKCIQEIHLVA